MRSITDKMRVKRVVSEVPEKPAAKVATPEPKTDWPHLWDRLVEAIAAAMKHLSEIAVLLFSHQTKLAKQRTQDSQEATSAIVAAIENLSTAEKKGSSPPHGWCFTCEYNSDGSFHKIHATPEGLDPAPKK